MFVPVSTPQHFREKCCTFNNTHYTKILYGKYTTASWLWFDWMLKIKKMSGWRLQMCHGVELKRIQNEVMFCFRAAKSSSSIDYFLIWFILKLTYHYMMNITSTIRRLLTNYGIQLAQTVYEDDLALLACSHCKRKCTCIIYLIISLITTRVSNWTWV